MMKRREVLKLMGTAAAGTLIPPGCVRTSRASPIRKAIPPDELTELVERIRTTPREGILDLAATSIRNGANPHAMLAAIFLAGVQDIRPQPIGGNLHSVMLIESSYRLVDQATSVREQWLFTLWALDQFKAAQREEHGDQWELPPAPRPRSIKTEMARRQLTEGLEERDLEKTDEAVVTLVRQLHRQEMYEIFWPYAARCIAYLGHKIVYGAMTEAVLRRIDWVYAEPCARSIAIGLAQGGDADTKRSWRRAVERSSELPDSWIDGTGNDPNASLAIMRGVLSGTYDEAQQAVVDALHEGLSTQTVWDGIRLAASDLFLKRRNIDPRSGEAIRSVHAVTEIWSMGHAWNVTRRESTKRAMMLQAAGWVAELRDALVQRAAIDLKGPSLLDLGADLDDDRGEGLKPILHDLFDRDDPSYARRFFDRHPRSAPAYLAALRGQLATKAREYHQFKYVIALEDELARIHPHWAAPMLATGLNGYMPTAASPDNGLAERSLHAMARAGI